MTVDYSAKAASALRMLTRFGQDVTRTASTVGTYNPATGAASVSTAATTRKGVKLPFTSGTTTVRGQLVQSEDAELYLDAEGAVTLTDKFTIGGAIFSVVSFDELAPAGTAVLYTVHIRRA